MPEPANRLSDASETSKSAEKADSKEQALVSNVYKAWSSKSWGLQEWSKQATAKQDFDKLVIDSPYGKSIDAQEFKMLDKNSDDKLSMDELEKGRQSGSFDDETVKGIDGLQKLISDHPGDTGVLKNAVLQEDGTVKAEKFVPTQNVIDKPTVVDDQDIKDEEEKKKS